VVGDGEAGPLECPEVVKESALAEAATVAEAS
jgi:hypothetical protein